MFCAQPSPLLHSDALGTGEHSNLPVSSMHCDEHDHHSIGKTLPSHLPYSNILTIQDLAKLTVSTPLSFALASRSGLMKERLLVGMTVLFT